MRGAALVPELLPSPKEEKSYPEDIIELMGIAIEGYLKTGNKPGWVEAPRQGHQKEREFKQALVKDEKLKEIKAKIDDQIRDWRKESV